ncbi:MAG: TauD/TfdA dioxygenase family protein [Alphaproteobacteria bacterium]|jgi:taurine dioxygenase
MKIQQASAGIVALVTGIDMRVATDQQWQELYQAWLDHAVLIIRDQELTIEQFLDHGRRFGRLKPHVVRKSRHAEYPELTVMGLGTRKPDGQIDKSIFNRGQSWHTDSPWDDEVCKATQLYGLEIPSVGGDKLFANMHMAYDSLPPALKQRIASLYAGYVYGGADRKGNDLLEPEDRGRQPTRYPLVRPHAETGKPSLYFNPHHIYRIADVSAAESDDLIAELTAHQIAPGAEYRHVWQVGDLVTWDNRCTLHAATGGYPIEERRVHWRCTIMQ